MTMPASSKGGGTVATTGPLDVVKVPAPPSPFVPTPCPNIAQVAQASGCCSKVKICGSPAYTMASKIPMSSGDEPGTLGGMKSNVFKNQAAPKKGSSKVTAGGDKVVHVTSAHGQNGSNANTAGLQVAPSQTKVLVAM